jgi:hypothetical protein
MIVGGYRVQGTHEFKEIPREQVHQLEIKARNPSVSVELRPGGSRLYASTDDGPAGRGAADEVRALLVKRVARPRHVARGAVAAGGPTVTLVSVWGLVLSVGYNRWALAVLAASGAVGSGLSTRWSWRALSERRNCVVLRRKMDSPRFFARNRDEIVLMLLSAVFGAVMARLLGS